MQNFYIDAVGGVAGDMFSGAVLDGWPRLRKPLFDALRSAGLDAIVHISSEPHTDGILTGTRFLTAPADANAPEADGPLNAAGETGTHNHRQPHSHDTGHEHSHEGHIGGHSHDHEHHAHGHTHPISSDAQSSEHAESTAPEHTHSHRRHETIAAWIKTTVLSDTVKARALDIFEHLARAEAQVHGIDVADVTFHEVGAWDSIADVLSAAWLIDALGPGQWFYAPLPLGRGRVNTAHGYLPVPAPATALLLEGFTLFQDGLDGERITPTGAAILKHLQPSSAPMSSRATLRGTGTGFGTKRFPGLSNVLRVSHFEVDGAPMPHDGLTADNADNADNGNTRHETIGLCEFEIDDQSAEDLAHALDVLRDAPGVLDITQTPTFGKKGRVATQVRILTTTASLDAVVQQSMSNTSTIGVRWTHINRTILARNIDTVDVDGTAIRVKRVHRPDGTITAKAESNDLNQHAQTGAARRALRERAESLSLRAENGAKRDNTDGAL